MRITYVLAGGVNRPRPDGRKVSGTGVSVLALDLDSGALTPVSANGRIDNPSFVAVSPDGHCVYATSDVESWDEGLVSAYRLDAGQLSYLNKQPSRGGGPGYLGVHPGGRWLFVSNYLVSTSALRPAQALTVLPVEADGGLGPPAASVAHHGRGSVAGRQDAPHPHCALPSPDGRFVLVADLGLDQVLAYPFDARTGALGPAVPTAISPGCGPRHMAFCGGGRFVLLVGELDNTVRLLAWEDGVLRPLASLPIRPQGWQGPATGADLAISADGCFAYVSTRGCDTIATVALDLAAGALVLVAHDPAPAKPRSLALAGDFLLVAGQDADAIAVLRRDPASGRLTDTGQRAAIGSPTCVRVQTP